MVKVERSFPAPASLAIEANKVNGSYSEPDVILQLRHDFHDKCYICELDCLQDPQVEHLLPHMGGRYLERKFDWNNLFWICGHCNGVKNQRKYDAGIIDCCREDPEELICFELRQGQVTVYPKNKENKRACLTSDLVMETFHLKNTGMRIYSCEIRMHELNLEMNKLYDAIEEMEYSAKNWFAIRKCKALLRRESRFAAFKRNYIRENGERFPVLLEFLT